MFKSTINLDKNKMHNGNNGMWESTRVETPVATQVVQVDEALHAIRPRLMRYCCNWNIRCT